MDLPINIYYIMDKSNPLKIKIFNHLLDLGLSKNKIKKLINTSYFNKIKELSLEEITTILVKDDGIISMNDFERYLKQLAKKIKQDKEEIKRERLETIRLEKNTEKLAFYKSEVKNIIENNLIAENGFVTEGYYKNCLFKVIERSIRYLLPRDNVDSIMKPIGKKESILGNGIIQYELPEILLVYEADMFSNEGIYLSIMMDYYDFLRKYFSKSYNSYEQNIINNMSSRKVWERTSEHFKKAFKDFINKYK